MAVRGDPRAAGVPLGGQPNKALVLLLFATLVSNLYQQQSTSSWSYATIDDDLATNPFDRRDEASDIVRRSYDRSYAHILPCDEDRGESGEKCMRKTFERIDANGTAAPSAPWWFHTLLRDVMSNGAYGFWHHFYTSDPPLNFCTMGKVATTEWRKVFCQLNADECRTEPNRCKNGCAWRTTKEMPEDAPWAVFLRDPLERLLSGYLDKCYKEEVRRRQGHCEPNAVFNPNPDMKDGKGKKYPPLLENLQIKDKQMFSAYVDAMPLKWNVHFVPQAIICDLHQRIGKYDFVGNMGKGFMLELERMADQFGGQLPRALNATFRYLEHVESGKENTGKDRNEHSTHAPAKVKQFYTARTVRRGLELLSIDYVLLGLEVPEWARQMLRDDAAGV